uniref:Uncharacterized protein n=1 Tax=Solanum lycopersicum TaxID=4081 RepID=A0A3Q7FP00_SOLLC
MKHQRNLIPGDLEWSGHGDSKIEKGDWNTGRHSGQTGSEWPRHVRSGHGHSPESTQPPSSLLLQPSGKPIRLPKSSRQQIGQTPDPADPGCPDPDPMLDWWLTCYCCCYPPLLNL